MSVEEIDLLQPMLRTDRGDGPSHIRPCLDLTLFWNVGLTASTKAVLDLVAAMEPDDLRGLTHYKTNDMSLARAISGSALAQWTSLLADRNVTDQEFFVLQQHGGRAPRDFALPSITLMSERERLTARKTREHLLLRFCLPVEDAPRLETLAVTAARQFPLYAGYAGYSLYYATGNIDAMRHVEAHCRYWLLRFPGLQHGDPQELLMYGTDGVLRIGWLTLLGPECTKKLGSPESLRKVLGDGVDLRIAPSGNWLIKAGEQPALGDLNRNHGLPLQKRVGSALSSLRVSDDLIGEMTIAGLEDEDKRAWIGEPFGDA